METVDYISERIINISELESIIQDAYFGMVMLRAELEKEKPHMCRIGVLSKQICSDLLKAKDFEFCVERRRAICPKD